MPASSVRPVSLASRGADHIVKVRGLWNTSTQAGRERGLHPERRNKEQVPSHHDKNRNDGNEAEGQRRDMGGTLRHQGAGKSPAQNDLRPPKGAV